jgi:hypothetical protein
VKRRNAKNRTPRIKTAGRLKNEALLKAGIKSAKNKRVPGLLQGKIFAPPSAFAPMTKRELREWGLI